MYSNAHFKKAKIRPMRGNITLIGLDLNYLNTKLVENSLKIISNTSVYSLNNVESLVLLAGASSSNTVMSINCGNNVGNEICMLKGARRRRLIEVPIMTIDKLVDDHIPSRIVDILIIDTEGHDPLVLEGAKSILKEGGIKIIVFEPGGIRTPAPVVRSHML